MADAVVFSILISYLNRCNDLLEINKTMLEFARYEEGKKMEISIFQGQFGKEIEKYELPHVSDLFD